MELKDRILEKYRRKIISGELEQGCAMPTQRELAEAEGISKSVAYAVFLSLEKEGLITITPRKRAVVAAWKTFPSSITLDSILEVTKIHPTDEVIKSFEEFRLINEGKCAALAAKNRDEDDLKRMRNALSGMRKAETDEKYIEMLLEFHRSIYAATHNIFYSALAAKFSDTFSYWQCMEIGEERNRIYTLLSNICDFIAQNDSVMAENAMAVYSYESSLIINNL